MPLRSQKPNKTRHFLQARGRLVLPVLCPEVDEIHLAFRAMLDRMRRRLAAPSIRRVQNQLPQIERWRTGGGRLILGRALLKNRSF